LDLVRVRVRVRHRGGLGWIGSGPGHPVYMIDDTDDIGENHTDTDRHRHRGRERGREREG